MFDRRDLLIAQLADQALRSQIPVSFMLHLVPDDLRRAVAEVSLPYLRTASLRRGFRELFTH